MKNTLKFILPMAVLLYVSACSSNRSSQENQDSVVSNPMISDTTGMQDSLNNSDTLMNGTLRDSAGIRP